MRRSYPLPAYQTDACFYVKEPPTYEFIDGMFHAHQAIGDYRFERVMSPHVFRRLVRAANEALALYEQGSNIIEIKRA